MFRNLKPGKKKVPSSIVFYRGRVALRLWDKILMMNVFDTLIWIQWKIISFNIKILQKIKLDKK